MLHTWATPRPARPRPPRGVADLRRAGPALHRPQLPDQAGGAAAAAGARGAAAARRRPELAQLPLRPRLLLLRGGDGDVPGRPGDCRRRSSSPWRSRSAAPTSACTTRPTSSSAPLLGVVARPARAALHMRAAPMKVGIVGLPNAGKSTLFNALTKGGAQTGDYPFTTIEPNVAVAQVPDERLEAVAETVRSSELRPGDDRLPRHRRPGQRRLRRGGARQPVPRLDPRDRRDLPRRPLPRGLRRAAPRRPRRPARRHRDDRDRAGPRRLRAGRAPARPGRQAGQVRRHRGDRRARLAAGGPRGARRRQAGPLGARSPTPPPTRSATSAP